LAKKSNRPEPKKNKYAIFAVAADILVVRHLRAKLDILLIQRKFEPYRNCWALPGGFLEHDEDALTAARRELEEETGLRCAKFVEFGSFSDPKRDPRGRTVTVAFYSVWNSRAGTPRASDDASHAQWFSTRRLPPLAFDHAEMIRKGLARYQLDTLSRRK